MLFVKDNFIADTELRGLIQNDRDFFPSVMPGENLGATLNEYHDEQCDCYAPYMYWDGWLNSPADTLKKRVIREIWGTEGLLPFPLEDVAGFEYWTRTFTAGQHLGIHVDEDTFMYADNKFFHGPAIGCVWYGFSEAVGGSLEIHEAGLKPGFNQLEADNVKALMSLKEDVERIYYRPNRLVVFDAGHRLHETTKIVSGKKQVMVVNVWHKGDPPKASIHGGFFYE